MIAQRPLGRTGISLSVLGAGTTRFPSADLRDAEGLDRCAALLARAVRYGVNYIDNAFSYAEGHSEEIVARLLRLVPRESVHIAVKSNSGSDPTADDVLRRVEGGLRRTGAAYFDFLYLWSVLDADQLSFLLRPGGPYEGALEAKKRGWVRHLLVSSHAPARDAEQIVDCGAFEGILLSYNLMSRTETGPVIDRAAARGMGVLIMNPLGGGILPQNETLFSGARLPGDASTAEAALRFAASRAGVTCVLAGLSGARDLDQAIHAFDGWEPDDAERNAREKAASSAASLPGLCTGCGYCRSACPLGLPIPEWMQSYHQKLLRLPRELYGLTEPEEIERAAVLGRLIQGFSILPASGESPCVGCGKCASVCTQHLPIPQRITELYSMIRASHASEADRRERLSSLLRGRGFRRVAFWPASGTTSFVLREYRRLFGEPDFEPLFFDSSPAAGTLDGQPVYGPQDLARLRPDCVLVASFRFRKVICEAVEPLVRPLGIPLLCLHQDGDAPWVF